jgi:hypothetical protein
MTTAMGHHVSTFSGAPRRRQASSLRSAPFGAIGLDRASVAPNAGNYVMAQGGLLEPFASAPYGREGRKP